MDNLDTLDSLMNYTKTLFTKISQQREKMPASVQKSGDPDNPCPQCWSLSPDNITLVDNRGVDRLGFAVYSAVYSAAQALHTLLQCDSGVCKLGENTKIYPWKVIFVKRPRAGKANITPEFICFL